MSIIAYQQTICIGISNNNNYAHDVSIYVSLDLVDIDWIKFPIFRSECLLAWFISAAKSGIQQHIGIDRIYMSWN